MSGRKMKRTLAMLLTVCTLMTQREMSIFATNKEVEESNGVPEGVVLNYREMEPIDSSFAGVKDRFLPVCGTLPVSYSASADVPMEVEKRDDYVTSVKEQEHGIT